MVNSIIRSHLLIWGILLCLIAYTSSSLFIYDYVLRFGLPTSAVLTILVYLLGSLVVDLIKYWRKS